MSASVVECVRAAWLAGRAVGPRPRARLRARAWHALLQAVIGESHMELALAGWRFGSRNDCDLLRCWLRDDAAHGGLHEWQLPRR